MNGKEKKDRLPPLTVIEASAGTGKTFSLVTHLMRLIFSGTEPERIVALTFSRMAAGEIFNSFIERLSRAAASDAAAAEESDRLGRELGRSRFAAMLRKVISRQHLSLIGTLDSFLMKLVRMIPLELGLEGEVKVMGDFRSPVERSRLIDEMMCLVSEDAKAVFREAFALAFDGAGAKSFLEDFDTFIRSWHARYRDMPLAAAWGEPSRIWENNEPPQLDVTLREIRGSSSALAPYAAKRGAANFIAAVAGFSGKIPDLFPVSLQEEPEAVAVWKKMLAWKVAQALRKTRGIYRLMHVYEAVYSAKVRKRGLITFDDVPRLIAGLGKHRLALEYRMDAKFDHWALDEFQDTSEGQWNALSNLIDESRQSGEYRSVFIVGDRKQAIYDWRGGDVRFLGDMVREALKSGNEKGELAQSRRYLPAISAAVNKVFGENVIRGLFDMDAVPESVKWRCPEHTSHKRSPEGFVQVIQAEKAASRASISDFFGPVTDVLNAVKPWERGISTAILVRKNDYGEAILAHLKSAGIDRVVFEGDSRVMDSPVLAVFVELVKLAEHPDDDYAYARIMHSPVAEALYPGGLPPKEEFSLSLLSDFTRMGMARKFREVREALKAVPDTWNLFTESRFSDLVKCAAEFEDVRDERTPLSAFADYLKEHSRRDYAEPGMVRILTMHQSKGLGFDHVIIPFCEGSGFHDPRHRRPLTGENGRWLSQDPSAQAALSDPVLAEADRRNRAQELYAELCLDYVAMTRAKKALTVILNPLNKTVRKNGNGEPSNFSDLIRTVGLETFGDAQWYLGESQVSGKDTSPVETPPAFVRPLRDKTRKVRPSDAFYRGLTGDRLFAGDFGAAAARGSEIHSGYEKIEWLEADSARTDLERALVRPEGVTALWREKPFEICADGEWVSGCFDRVVFTESDGERSAVISDFKTNRLRAGETREAFARRMAETYRGQMDSYRLALSRLTGIPVDRVRAQLLLHETGDAV